MEPIYTQMNFVIPSRQIRKEIPKYPAMWNVFIWLALIAAMEGVVFVSSSARNSYAYTLYFDTSSCCVNISVAALAIWGFLGTAPDHDLTHKLRPIRTTSNLEFVC